MASLVEAICISFVDASERERVARATAAEIAAVLQLRAYRNIRPNAARTPQHVHVAKVTYNLYGISIDRTNNA
jgi:hypothetical protein